MAKPAAPPPTGVGPVTPPVEAPPREERFEPLAETSPRAERAPTEAEDYREPAPIERDEPEPAQVEREQHEPAPIERYDREPARVEAEPVEPSPPGEPKPATPAPAAQPATMTKAIELVSTIIGELKTVLDEMELVLEYLEDAERQQMADERQIKMLQKHLESLHHRLGGRGQPRRPHEHESRRHGRLEDESD
jgi:hypothetical protein